MSKSPNPANQDSVAVDGVQIAFLGSTGNEVYSTHEPAPSAKHSIASPPGSMLVMSHP
jgi:hypothetical protein